jgi:hypothetical protein
LSFFDQLTKADNTNINLLRHDYKSGKRVEEKKAENEIDHENIYSLSGFQNFAGILTS